MSGDKQDKYGEPELFYEVLFFLKKCVFFYAKIFNSWQNLEKPQTPSSHLLYFLTYIASSKAVQLLHF